MSFMSFDYAMRASEATLSFHQNQGQNIKDTNSRVREVGTGNAKRKDDLVRQKIEAEFEAKSADIKKEKAQQLMKIAEERKHSAQLAQAIVGIGTFVGGMIDGAVDMLGKDKSQVADSEQMTISSEAVEDGYAVGFRIGAGENNTEQGAMVAFDPDKGNFSVTGLQTTSGQVNGFVSMSATDMATHILDAVGNEVDNPASENLRSMIDQGPPPMFKSDYFKENEDGTFELEGGLKEALFGNGGNQPGFFSQGANGNTGSDAGENMVAGLLKNPASVSNAYNATANTIVSMLRDPKIQSGLKISPETADRTEKAFENKGLTVGSFDKFTKGAGDGIQKMLFKPLGTSLNQFMALAKITKEYEEEFNAKAAEYENAKKQAAAAREKLQKLESLLASGDASS